MKKSYVMPSIKQVQIAKEDICAISLNQNVLDDGNQWSDIRPFG